MTNTLRFGILGAAKIAPKALVIPARELETVEVTVIAAREKARADKFASLHGIRRVADSYREVIEADDVDVVYIPLPMNLHAKWTIEALRAGKHVLCEKPFASNAAEATEMVAVAKETGRSLGEAFHYWYHPLYQRVLDILASGSIGRVIRAAGWFNIRVPNPDLRWDYETSGGSLMDLGCYSTHWVRHSVGEEPTVTSAQAEVGPADVDASIRAELAFPSGAVGVVESSMVQDEPAVGLRIEGTKGDIEVTNLIHPSQGNRLKISTRAGSTIGQVNAGVTYSFMLRSFVDHIRHQVPFPTSGSDSIANMAAIDAIYSSAGLRLRGHPQITSP